MNKYERLNGHSLTRGANLQIDPLSIDEEERKISFIIISKNNDGERVDYWEGKKYIERLEVKGAIYTSLKTFFKDHNRGVDSAIGRVSNIRVENDELKCDVYFSGDSDSVRVFDKYKDGILTDVSVGYKINSIKVEQREGELDLVSITSFEVLELSAVGIGFDKGAKVGRNKETMDKEFLEELNRLRAIETKSVEQETRIKELEQIQRGEDNQIDEKSRCLEINTLADTHNIEAKQRDKFIQDGVSVDEVRKFILDEKAKASTTIRVGERNNIDSLRSVLEDVMCTRYGIAVAKPHEDIDKFRGATPLDMARMLTNYDGYNKSELAQRAMSTSSFPLLLGNVSSKVLTQGYEEAEATYHLWTKPVDLPDFKYREEVRFKNPNRRLNKLNEGGEKKSIEFNESGNKWRLYSYGDKFVITREMLINDDLGAFIDSINVFGKMAKNTSNGIVYDFLQSKGDYSKNSIFSASNGNLSATGTALGIDALSAGRVAMRRQKDGNTPLNINPKYLLVSPENETMAHKILTSTSDISANNSGVTNPFRNALTPIVEAELDSNPWYLMAENNTVKVGYLQGTNRQPLVKTKEIGIGDIEFEGVYDFGICLEDFRGMYKNKGAN